MKIKKIKNKRIIPLVFFVFLFFLTIIFLKNNYFINKKNKMDFINYKNFSDYSSKKNFQNYLKNSKNPYKSLFLLKYMKKHLKISDIIYILKNFKDDQFLKKNILIKNILYFRIYKLEIQKKIHYLNLINLNKIEGYPWINFSELYFKNISKNKLFHKENFFYWIKVPYFIDNFF
ncbi:hypothetical protein [Buchnera aphidicola]|uniref:hypothetical protein n=1 Tax=Buchnera aphidicola TaxID=9 RepID=UPI0031B86F6F